MKSKMPVFNGTEKIRLVIVRDDIRRAKPKDPRKCAAAVAFKRQVPHCTDAEVGTAVTYLTMAADKTHDGPYIMRFRTPAAFVRELVSFDRSRKMAPGEFTFPPRQPSHRPTGTRMGSSTNQNNKTGKKRPARRRIPGIRAIVHKLYET